MAYKRPKLVMACGSAGGYIAMQEILENCDSGVLERGALYFLEHGAPFNQQMNYFKKMDWT